MSSGPAPISIDLNPDPVRVRVLAALSCPRLGFTDQMFIATQLVKMNIELRKHSGAFWEQSLSQLLYQAVDEDFDFVLTLDYDTIFRPTDVWYMLNLMVNEPKASAIFPVQYRREADQLLLGVREHKDGTIQANSLADHLVPATVGHFGCTFIRVADLKRMPHPWLHSKPGPTGKWDDGRVDADVAFWNNLRACGFKMFCATRCVVGHLQQMITWPGEGYLPVHQYSGKYFKDGDAPPIVIQSASYRATNGVDHAASEIHSKPSDHGSQDGDSGRGEV